MIRYLLNCYIASPRFGKDKKKIINKKIFFWIFYLKLCIIIFKQIEMKNLIAILVATLGIHTDNYLVMTGSIVVIIYLIVKK